MPSPAVLALVGVQVHPVLKPVCEAGFVSIRLRGVTDLRVTISSPMREADRPDRVARRGVVSTSGLPLRRAFSSRHSANSLSHQTYECSVTHSTHNQSRDTRSMNEDARDPSEDVVGLAANAASIT